MLLGLGLGLALALVKLASEVMDVIRMDLGRSKPEIEASKKLEVIRMDLGKVLDGHIGV